MPPFGQFRRVARRTSRRTARRNAPEQSEQHTTAQDAPAKADPTQELENLAKLKSEGVITEEEFEAKKKQILGI